MSQQLDDAWDLTSLDPLPDDVEDQLEKLRNAAPKSEDMFFRMLAEGVYVTRTDVADG